MAAPPTAVEHTLSFLADIYQFVIVDCPPGLTGGTLAAIAQSETGCNRDDRRTTGGAQYRPLHRTPIETGI